MKTSCYGKVLIVDDSKRMQNLMAKVLTKMNQAVLLAENGKEAIKIAKKQMPDLVLLSLKLTDADSYEVVKKIRQVNKSIKIILIVGYGNAKLTKQLLQEGAFDYIAKPFHIGKIRRKINRALKTKTGTGLKKHHAKRQSKLKVGARRGL